MQANEIDKDVQRLNRLFQIASNANCKNGNRDYRHACENFYYNDVDKTKSQFTDRQKEEIRRTYNIPISSKLTFAIVESMLAFLTATKPFPRLISAEPTTEEFVNSFTGAYHCTWYESGGNSVVTNAMRDALTTGNGWVLVRRATFFDEATTNTVIEYIPWKHVFVDPESRKDDYSDAEFIVTADVMRKEKAERLYDVNIPDAQEYNWDSLGSDTGLDELANDFAMYGYSQEKKDKFVWVKTFYERKEINVYISENGDVSTKRPIPTQIPNDEKLQLMEKLNAATNKAANQLATRDVVNESVDEAVADPGFAAADGKFEENIQDVAQARGEAQDTEVAASDQSAMVGEMQMQYAQMPDMVEAYEMELETYGSKEPAKKVTVKEVVRQKKKFIIVTRMVGDQKVDVYKAPCEAMPLINFNFAHFNDPNRVFGVVHFILDLVKGMNKYISEVMYDISVNGHRKPIFWRTTVAEPSQIEKNWASPNQAIMLDPDPSIQGGGAPIILEPSPANQSIQYMIEYFKSLVEYITGIFGVIQGDPSNSPNTFGATSSLQNYGSQRLKLTSRGFESSFERLAYVIVNYLQAYIPRDRILKYFNADGKPDAVMIPETSEDMKFKVRVEITNMLPTTKQMYAQILGFLAQTAGDPGLQGLLTEHMLTMADVPEGKELAEKMDTVKQLNQQLQQAQKQIEDMSSELAAAKNQSEQKEIAMGVNQKVAEADKQLALTNQEAAMNAQSQEEQAQAEPAPSPEDVEPEQQEMPF